MNEALDIVHFPGFNYGKVRTTGEFSGDEIAAIHHSEHVVFNVAELLAESERRMFGISARAGRVTQRIAQVMPGPEIQLELI